jgi:hypothetical protein
MPDSENVNGGLIQQRKTTGGYIQEESVQKRQCPKINPERVRSEVGG